MPSPQDVYDRRGFPAPQELIDSMGFSKDIELNRFIENYIDGYEITNTTEKREIFKGFLKTVYGKFSDVVRIPEVDPNEIIVPIYKDSSNVWGMALVLVDTSNPHYHIDTLETYHVLAGCGAVFCRDHGTNSTYFHELKKDRVVTIQKQCNHWITTIVPVVLLVVTAPSWRLQDHILVTDQKDLF